MRNRFFLALVLLLVGAAHSRAGLKQQTQLNNAENALSDLNHTNHMEMDMAMLAKDRWVTEQVRSYAEMLLTDHRKSLEDVEKLSKNMKLNLSDPDEMTADEHAAMEELRGLKGEEFERRFAAIMSAGHKKAIARFQVDRKKVTGPTKELITQTLPTLKKHQKAAHDLVILLNKPRPPAEPES